MEYTKPRHPIGYVTQRTGLSTHVLRVWERRYGAVKPLRTATNRRLYSDADVDRLRLLHTLSKAGHSIGQIANMKDAELKKLVRDLSEPSPIPREEDAPAYPEQEKHLAALLNQCQEAIRTMDNDALEKALAKARVSFPETVVLERFLPALILWVGEGWHNGLLRVAHEHLATATIRGFLGRMQQRARPVNGAPTLVAATPAGEYHELGVLLAATSAAQDGWHVLYFGPNLPAPELANAADDAGARAIALSIAAPGDDPAILQEIEDLMQFLPDSTTVLVGGEGAQRSAAFLSENGAVCVKDLAEFRDRLQTIRQ